MKINVLKNLIDKLEDFEYTTDWFIKNKHKQDVGVAINWLKHFMIKEEDYNKIKNSGEATTKLLIAQQSVIYGLKTLEKENAELKDRIAAMGDSYDDLVKQNLKLNDKLNHLHEVLSQ